MIEPCRRRCRIRAAQTDAPANSAREGETPHSSAEAQSSGAPAAAPNKTQYLLEFMDPARFNLDTFHMRMCKEAATSLAAAASSLQAEVDLCRDSAGERAAAAAAAVLSGSDSVLHSPLAAVMHAARRNSSMLISPPFVPVDLMPRLSEGEIEMPISPGDSKDASEGAISPPSTATGSHAAGTAEGAGGVSAEAHTEAAASDADPANKPAPKRKGSFNIFDLESLRSRVPSIPSISRDRAQTAPGDEKAARRGSSSSEAGASIGSESRSRNQSGESESTTGVHNSAGKQPFDDQEGGSGRGSGSGGGDPGASEAPPRSGATVFSAALGCHEVSVLLVTSLSHSPTPIARVQAHNIMLAVRAGEDGAEASTELALVVDHFNRHIAQWEPVVERCCPLLELIQWAPPRSNS